MMAFLSTIKADFHRYTSNQGILNKIKIVFFSHAFHLVFLIRAGMATRKIPFFGSFLGLAIEYLIRIIFASDISCRARIDDGLMIVHGHDIVIGSHSTIGRNCKIFNGVTLGNKDTEAQINEQPVIGEDVVIGTGSKLLGGIFVGNRVKIGANSVVITNIPDDSIAIGVPARVKSTNNKSLLKY